MAIKNNLLVSVVGPTASGKTRFAIKLAKQNKSEILSADSRQFYREMEIGTAKPTETELSEARHHFINSHSIHEDYSVGKFERDALELLRNLFERYDVVIAVGGSGLYMKALWEGLDEMPDGRAEIREVLNQEFQEKGLENLLGELKNNDPEYYEKVDRHNHQRVIRALEVIRTTGKPFSSFRKSRPAQNRFYQNIKIGMELDREVLYKRIDTRMDQMIAAGLFEEAERLVPFKDHNALQTVGYSEIFHYLDGKYDYHEAVRLLKRNSRRYAKRQLTWFKKDPEIIWMTPDEIERAIALIDLG